MNRSKEPTLNAPRGAHPRKCPFGGAGKLRANLEPINH
uniref:Orf26 n=1 Tax=Serratia marcescens TaxID=615 RepID=A0A7S6YKK4_SERMA|nr:Orf26 [Serratia marcescens]